MDRTRQKRKKTHIRSGRLAVALVFSLIILAGLIWLTLHILSKDSEGDDTVSLKKSSTPISESSTSQADSSSADESSQPDQQVNVNIPKVQIGSTESSDAGDSVTLKWAVVAGADGYYVYRTADGNTEKFTVEGNGNTTYVDSKVEPEKTYEYKVNAFVNADGKTYEGAEGVTVSVTTNKKIEYKQLYFVPKGTYFYNEDGSVYKSTMTEGYFTGAPDESGSNKIFLDAELGTKFVITGDNDGIEEVKGAVALSTDNIGQEGGEINGVSACGPTAAAILVKAETGEVWNKDELIRYTEKYGLADQGSMMGEVGEGGMSAPMVIKLIESYSQGRISATNEYNAKEKPSVQLMNLIDSGKRCILSVRYAWGIVHHPYSIIHFVTVGAYEKAADGKVYFYYSDSAHGNDLRGLSKVEADEIDQSVVSVEGEPICMITVKLNGEKAKADAEANAG